jgi:hypothetical protein
MRGFGIGIIVAAAAMLAPLAWGAAAPDTAGASPSSEQVYVARLTALNSKVSGTEASGEARLQVANGKLTIRIEMQGVPPDMEHWQHFHGFKNDKDASCATERSDANHDGIVDLIETEPVSGTTMVPFNADPVAMDVPDNTYPRAAADGSFHYEKTVSLAALRKAFAKAFGKPKLDLDRRVVYIHGVPPGTPLPSSVASLGTIPAQVTLPMACGKIERVTR